MESTNDFIQTNQSCGLFVTRKGVVVGYGDLLVWTLYGAGSKTGNKLESQVSSPEKKAQNVYNN